VSTAKKAATPRGIEDVLALARPRQTEVRLCLAGDLAARADRLAEQIEAASARHSPSSLADVDPRTALTAELDEVHAAMRPSEVVFRFQAQGRTAYSDLLAAHPPRPGVADDGSWNNDTYPHALIAACCIEPVMTVEQVGELSEVLNHRQRNELFSAAWGAQVGETRVPSSRVASTNR
jgi:predicted transcriptional regulator